MAIAGIAWPCSLETGAVCSRVTYTFLHRSAGAGNLRGIGRTGFVNTLTREKGGA
jgi:hypothetical protein